MKRSVVLLTIPWFLASAFLVFLMVWGCAPSREDQIRTRLDAFKAILPEPLRESFEQGDYAGVVVQVDSLLEIDPVFKTRWEEMKAAEAINLFSTAEVIDYFVTYFVNYRPRR